MLTRPKRQVCRGQLEVLSCTCAVLPPKVDSASLSLPQLPRSEVRADLLAAEVACRASETSSTTFSYDAVKLSWRLYCFFRCSRPSSAPRRGRRHARGRPSWEQTLCRSTFPLMQGGPGGQAGQSSDTMASICPTRQSSMATDSEIYGAA